MAQVSKTKWGSIFVTDRVRSTREGNVLILWNVCLFHRGGTYLREGGGYQTLDGGYLPWMMGGCTYPWEQGGTYLGWGLPPMDGGG